MRVSLQRTNLVAVVSPTTEAPCNVGCTATERNASHVSCRAASSLSPSHRLSSPQDFQTAIECVPDRTRKRQTLGDTSTENIDNMWELSMCKAVRYHAYAFRAKAVHWVPVFTQENYRWVLGRKNGCGRSASVLHLPVL